MTARWPSAAAAALLAALPWAGGCAGGGGVDQPLRLDHISFRMHPGANDNAPAHLTLVRVAEDELLKELLQIESEAWFGEAGRAFRNKNPDALYDDWEVVPGRVSGPFDVELDDDEEVGGVLFCDTASAAPPMRLEADGDMTVNVAGDGCTVVSAGRDESFLERLRRRKLVSMTFATAADANGSRPVRVELVRTADAELVTDLLRLDPQIWFGRGGREFRAAHSSALFDYWELVPGTTFGPVDFAVNADADGVLFCAVPGGAPLRFAWEDEIEVAIDDEGCRVGAEEPAMRGGQTWNPLRWWRARTGREETP